LAEVGHKDQGETSMAVVAHDEKIDVEKTKSTDLNLTMIWLAFSRYRRLGNQAWLNVRADHR